MQLQKIIQEEDQQQENLAELNLANDIPLRYILFWGVILGLFMNWMAMYLKISMGFVSVGIGPMAVLLIARHVLKQRNLATRKNLTTILIAYGATQAAEASVGLLFLLWLATNSSFFGVPFNPPWWLLPSSEVLDSRTILSVEWIVPLLVHYALMLIPGIIGLILGWYMKDWFIHDDDNYPFPGVINQDTQVAVLTDESDSKGPKFWKVAKLGFVISLITILIPGFFVIDFSDLSVGYIFGIMLGPVGIALLAAGILIGNSKISITPLFSSIFAYSILGVIFISNTNTDNYFDFFTFLLQDVYFVPTLGLILGGLIVGPIFWGVLRSIITTSKDNNEASAEGSQEEEYEKDMQLLNDLDGQDQTTSRGLKIGLMKILRDHYRSILVITLIYFLMIVYVQSLNIIPIAPLWVIAILIFWNIIVGGVINGYLVTLGTAKSNSALSPPFLFDMIPIFLAGGSGYVSYVAMPTAETDGSAGIVSAQKLALKNEIPSRLALIAYISGYLATSLTTPLFALIMWKAFGIGTEAFPAPAFPVNGAIITSFAARDVTSFIDIKILAIAMGCAVLVASKSTDIILGIAIGLLFPPHMALPMAIGGLIRIYLQRKYGEDKAREEGSVIGPGLAVGASFVIPIMILLAFLV